MRSDYIPNSTFGYKTNRSAGHIDEEDEVSRKFKQHIERRPLDMYAAHFPAWYKFSHQFVAIVGGKAHLSSKTQQKYLHNTEKIISGVQAGNDGKARFFLPLLELHAKKRKSSFL